MPSWRGTDLPPPPALESLVPAPCLLHPPGPRKLGRTQLRGVAGGGGRRAAALFPCLFILVLGWGRGARAVGTEVWFSADFHEVRPAEVETERQDRSQWQAELGRGGGGVPAPDRWIHLHQGSVLSLPSPVFPLLGWVAHGWGFVFVTSAHCPRPPPHRPLSAPRVRGEDHCCLAERAVKNTGEACLAPCKAFPLLLPPGHRTQRARHAPPGRQRDV